MESYIFIPETNFKPTFANGCLPFEFKKGETYTIYVDKYGFETLVYDGFPFTINDVRVKRMKDKNTN